MRLPYLKSRNNHIQRQTVAFRGVNYGEMTADGQLESCSNLSSDKYPCLTPRTGREKGESYQDATAVWYKDGLLVVDGTDLIYKGEIVGTVSPGKKQFANINTKVVIMPDKVVFDTKTKELRGLGAEYTAKAATTFEGSDKESKLYTHIGSFVESIAGSGNVGGNDALGENGPTFCDDVPPFSSVYKSAKVNEGTGVLELSDALEGDSFTAENVQVGYGFVAENLGADGVKKFGRVTGKTKFTKGGSSYVWNKYNVKYTSVATGSVVQENFIHTSTDIDDDEDDHPYWTREISMSYGNYTLYYGSIPVLDENGTVVDIQDKKIFSTRIPVGSNRETALSFPAGAEFVVGYYKAYNGSRKMTSVFCARNLYAVTDRYDFDQEDGDRIDYFGVVNVKLKGYIASTNIENGGTHQGKVISATMDYPEDGFQDYAWYVLQGRYDSLDYYGFDYDLIAPEDGFESGESGWEKVNFRKGDTVEVSGCTSAPDNNKTATIRDILEEMVDGVSRHVLVFDGGVFQSATEESGVMVARKVPNLSVICENQNRLFGAEGNTIYVSALGDPTNLYTYDGVDTDSYSVSVATEGHFTGCIGYGKSVLFFKEDCMHKLLGDYPSEYTLYDYVIPGVRKGSEESLWNINEVVYYHGREGVYRYAGGAPELISDAFGLRRFQNAAAGADGERLYISMQDKKDGLWGMWVYDIQKGIWLQEDDTQAVGFCRDGGKLYYIDGKNSDLVLINPESSDEKILWNATLCRMDETYHNRKCYSRLMLRADLDEGAWMEVEISCDGGKFQSVYTSRKSRAKTLVIPIIPNRCDNFRVRISGEGNVIIRSVVREFSLGSIY